MIIMMVTPKQFSTLWAMTRPQQREGEEEMPAAISLHLGTTVMVVNSTSVTVSRYPEDAEVSLLRLAKPW